jgi:DNA-binding transcriptional MerR regulator
MSKVVIPDKMFFKIGEVAKITGVKPYILRYWETEFPHLRPSKGRSQHRLYRRKDVEDILRIKELLYAEKFTIAGARQILKGEPAEAVAAQAALTGLPQAPAPVPVPAAPAKVDPRLREELLAIRELVGRL